VREREVAALYRKFYKIDYVRCHCLDTETEEQK
jgi:hypothetical protein